MEPVDSDTIIAICTYEIDRDPNNAGAFKDRARAHMDKRDFRAATADFTEAVLIRGGCLEPTRSRIVAKVALVIEQAINQKPKWDDRYDVPGLGRLSAPMFLKHVHPDKIGKDGAVYREVIRAIDPRGIIRLTYQV
jgi:hypothetical protein